MTDSGISRAARLPRDEVRIRRMNRDSPVRSDERALEWLSSARNYARYSNQGGQYGELIGYLKRIRRW